VTQIQEVLSECLKLFSKRIGADSIQDESPTSGAEDLIQHGSFPFWPVKAEEKRSLLGAVGWAGKGPTQVQKVGKLMSAGPISA
jgi:hypothetical protein